MHPAGSVAQRYKVDNQPNFAAIDGMHQYGGPMGAGAGMGKMNRSSTSFVFESKQLSPDKPLALSTDTSTGVLGARSEMGQLPGMEV